MLMGYDDAAPVEYCTRRMRYERRSLVAGAAHADSGALVGHIVDAAIGISDVFGPTNKSGPTGAFLDADEWVTDHAVAVCVVGTRGPLPNVSRKVFEPLGGVARRE